MTELLNVIHQYYIISCKMQWRVLAKLRETMCHQPSTQISVADETQLIIRKEQVFSLGITHAL